MAESNMLGTSLAASTQSRNSRSWVGTKMFKPLCMNSSTSKYPMRFLLNALILGVAMDPKMDHSLPSTVETSGVFNFLMAFACTLLCMALGFLWVIARYCSLLQQHLHRMNVNFNFGHVLKFFRVAGGSLRASETK